MNKIISQCKKPYTVSNSSISYFTHIIHNKKLENAKGSLVLLIKVIYHYTIHVDDLSPMESTIKFCKYIFAAVDAISKFVWLFSPKSTGADEVVRNLKVFQTFLVIY